MREPSANRLPPILPIGTAVVALVELRGADGRPVHVRGATGVIVTAPVDPDHSYRVRLDGGDDFSLKRRELQVLSHYNPDRLFHESEYRRLRARLETEGSATTLPEVPSCRDELNALLVRVRLDAHERGFSE